MLPAPPSPDVPLNERNDRLAAVRREMAQHGVDFLVLTDQKNIEYFTDYRTLSWGYHSRPLFVVIDHQDILVVANKTAATPALSAAAIPSGPATPMRLPR
jgi:Xaa-Pro aminopeptidase